MIIVFDEPAVTTGTEADAAEVPASAAEEEGRVRGGGSPPQREEEVDGSGDRVGRNTLSGAVGKRRSSAGRGGGVEMEGRVPVDGRGDRGPTAPLFVAEGGDDVVDTLSDGRTPRASSACSASCATVTPPSASLASDRLG